MRTAIQFCGNNGNLVLLCDSPSPSSAGELLCPSNKPEVAQACVVSCRTQPSCKALVCVLMDLGRVCVFDLNLALLLSQPPSSMSLQQLDPKQHG